MGPKKNIPLDIKMGDIVLDVNSGEFYNIEERTVSTRVVLRQIRDKSIKMDFIQEEQEDGDYIVYKREPGQ